jgi:hypothetical protein
MDCFFGWLFLPLGLRVLLSDASKPSIPGKSGNYKRLFETINPGYRIGLRVMAG